MEQAVRFGFSRRRAAFTGVLLVLLCLLLAGIVATGGITGIGGVLLVVSFAGAIALGLANAATRLVWRGPVLLVDGDGILDRRLGERPIPWSCVRQAYSFRYRRALYLAVVADLPEDFAAPPSLFLRARLWADDALRLPRFSLLLSGLDAPEHDIVAAVGRHLPDSVATAAPQRRRWL